MKRSGFPGWRLTSKEKSSILLRREVRRHPPSINVFNPLENLRRRPSEQENSCVNEKKPMWRAIEHGRDVWRSNSKSGSEKSGVAGRPIDSLNWPFANARSQGSEN